MTMIVRLVAPDDLTVVLLLVAAPARKTMKPSITTTMRKRRSVLPVVAVLLLSARLTAMTAKMIVRFVDAAPLEPLVMSDR